MPSDTNAKTPRTCLGFPALPPSYSCSSACVDANALAPPSSRTMLFGGTSLLMHIALGSPGTGPGVLGVKHSLRHLQRQRVQPRTLHVGGTRPILLFLYARRTALVLWLGLLLCLPSPPTHHGPLATRSTPCALVGAYQKASLCWILAQSTGVL